MWLPALTVSFRPDDVGVVDEACRAVAGCGAPSLLSIAAVVVLGAVLAVFVGAALYHLKEARSVVAAERDRAASERDAFAAFAGRLESIDATPSQSVEAGGNVVSLAAQPADHRLERIREAYRDTVMAVSHYDQEYGEPLAANMAAELGEEIAAAVTENRQLTPRVKGTLLQASREAMRRREQLIDDLDREEADLAEATTALGEIESTRTDIDSASVHDRGFFDLQQAWERLDGLEDRCQRVVKRRQATLAQGPESRAVPDAPSLQEYLYGPLDVDHPVVADATTVLGRLRDTKSSVVDALARRA